MAEICEVCGLPKAICACGELSKDQQRIRIRMEKRKWNKPATIIDGIDSKTVDIGKIAAELKAFCACGGTAKNDQIILQGNHKNRSLIKLIQLGFSKENIDVQ